MVDDKDNVRIRLLWDTHTKGALRPRGEIVALPTEEAESLIKQACAMRYVEPRKFASSPEYLPLPELSLAGAFKAWVLEDPELQAWFEVLQHFEVTPDYSRLSAPEWLMVARDKPAPEPQFVDITTMTPPHHFNYRLAEDYQKASDSYQRARASWENRHRLRAEWHLSQCERRLIGSFFQALASGDLYAQGVPFKSGPRRKSMAIALGWWMDQRLFCRVLESALVAMREEYRGCGGEFIEIRVRSAARGTGRVEPKGGRPSAKEEIEAIAEKVVAKGFDPSTHSMKEFVGRVTKTANKTEKDKGWDEDTVSRHLSRWSKKRSKNSA